MNIRMDDLGVYILKRIKDRFMCFNTLQTMSTWVSNNLPLIDIRYSLQSLSTFCFYRGLILV